MIGHILKVFAPALKIWEIEKGAIWKIRVRNK